MIKILGISMLASISLLPLRVEAQSMNLNLAPKESKALSNPTPLTINATCTIQTTKTATTEKITVNVVKSESHVNGQKLHCGQQKSIHVHNHDSISVSAEPGAEVTIVNQGTNVIQASCST